ncbi:MAG TPA: hypothetical protein VK024_00565 [Actinomycetaceae bacterium]|nr:hypothetical protein [Actinomycetaceae bacterium]
MSEHTAPVYTRAAPPVPSARELRATIPGWGADLDPSDRPSHPKEASLPTGAHWQMPERQPELRRRERSIEHEQLPAVFGTTLPPRGVAGLIRRFSYWRYGEGRTRRWLLLMAADRVDVVEHRLREAKEARKARAGRTAPPNRR